MVSFLEYFGWGKSDDATDQKKVVVENQNQPAIGEKTLDQAQAAPVAAPVTSQQSAQAAAGGGKKRNGKSKKANKAKKAKKQNSTKKSHFNIISKLWYAK